MSICCFFRLFPIFFFLSLSRVCVKKTKREKKVCGFVLRVHTRARDSLFTLETYNMYIQITMTNYITIC
jgi:hypothetical protein